MKAALRASLKDKGWCDQLPWVMLGLRTAPKEDLQSSAAELVYRQPLPGPRVVSALCYVPLAVFCEFWRDVCGDPMYTHSYITTTSFYKPLSTLTVAPVKNGLSWMICWSCDSWGCWLTS